jgi:hypothetical protein
LFLRIVIGVIKKVIEVMKKVIEVVSQFQKHSPATNNGGVTGV